MEYEFPAHWHVTDEGVIQIHKGRKTSFEIHMTGEQLLRLAADISRAASMKLRKDARNADTPAK